MGLCLRKSQALGWHAFISSAKWRIPSQVLHVPPIRQAVQHHQSVILAQVSSQAIHGRPLLGLDYQSICPTSWSPGYAIVEGLRPFTQWIRLTNANTFISGPFNFANIDGRKSCNQDTTPSPSFPNYFIHSGQFHSTFECVLIKARIDACSASPSGPHLV